MRADRPKVPPVKGITGAMGRASGFRARTVRSQGDGRNPPVRTEAGLSCRAGASPSRLAQGAGHSGTRRRGSQDPGGGRETFRDPAQPPWKVNLVRNLVPPSLWTKQLAADPDGEQVTVARW
jgi:hypothetical protein